MPPPPPPPPPHLSSVTFVAARCLGRKDVEEEKYNAIPPPRRIVLGVRKGDVNPNNRKWSWNIFERKRSMPRMVVKGPKYSWVKC